jgi:hypothetical protein
LASGVTVNAPKVIVPVFVRRLIPVPPDPVELVVPKLKAALDVPTLIPMPVGFVMVVLPLTVKLPSTLAKVIPVEALLTEFMFAKVAANVPVVRLSACPVRLGESLISVSAIVRVPKLVPLMPEVVALPIVRPRIVLAVLPFVRPIAIAALVIFVIVPLPLFIAGKAVLPVGTVPTPAIDARVAVASCPISF